MKAVYTSMMHAILFYYILQMQRFFCIAKLYSGHLISLYLVGMFICFIYSFFFVNLMLFILIVLIVIIILYFNCIKMLILFYVNILSQLLQLRKKYFYLIYLI